MKLIASFITGAALLLVLQADALTNTTDRYLDGSLEPRLEELGTEKTTGIKKPQWRLTVEDGVRRHCAATLRARGVSTEGTLCHNAK